MRLISIPTSGLSRYPTAMLQVLPLQRHIIEKDRAANHEGQHVLSRNRLKDLGSCKLRQTVRLPELRTCEGLRCVAVFI